MAVIIEGTVEDFAMVNFSVDYATVDTAALIAAAQSMAETYCDRTFDYNAATVDTIDGDGEDTIIQVDRWPIITLTSVVESGTTLTTGTDYLGYLTDGYIRRTSGGRISRPWRNDLQGIVVTYDGGYQVAEVGDGATLPDDLKAILSRIVGRLFRAGAPWLGATTAVGAARSVSLDGIGSVTYDDGTTAASQSDSAELLDDEKAALYPYLKPGLT